MNFQHDHRSKCETIAAQIAIFYPQWFFSFLGSTPLIDTFGIHFLWYLCQLSFAFRKTISTKCFVLINGFHHKIMIAQINEISAENPQFFLIFSKSTCFWFEIVKWNWIHLDKGFYKAIYISSNKNSVNREIKRSLAQHLIHLYNSFYLHYQANTPVDITVSLKASATTYSYQR